MDSSSLKADAWSVTSPRSTSGRYLFWPRAEADEVVGFAPLFADLKTLNSCIKQKCCVSVWVGAPTAGLIVPKLAVHALHAHYLCVLS